jgi:hypothetical protein
MNMSNTVETLTKMIIQLPESMQERVMEDVKTIVAEALDETHWHQLYQETSGRLSNVAKKVRSQVASGKAKPMDYDRL